MPMLEVIPTALPEVRLIRPQVFGDERGFFFESFNALTFAKRVQADIIFVQDNHSRSAHGVLRGLHYQIAHAQGKLVRVIAGTVYDVIVDLRRSSPRFGQWVGVRLMAEERQMLWIPPGFAHGFLTLSASAEFLYKTTDYWYPEYERTVRWDDPTLAITWPLEELDATHASATAAPIAFPLLAAKDAAGLFLPAAEVYA